MCYVGIMKKPSKSTMPKIVTVAVSLRLEQDFLEEFEEFARKNRIRRTPAIKIAMQRLMKSGI